MLFQVCVIAGDSQQQSEEDSTLIMKQPTHPESSAETGMKKQAGRLASFLRFALFTGKAVLIATVLFSVYANLDISRRAERNLYTTVRDVPEHTVGIVLGTSWASRSGSQNHFFTYRIQAAAALYRAGKIQYILASGDNQFLSYNEPRRMRQELIALGVAPQHIYLDFAGFSTLDSIYRAKEVFQLDRAIVISQAFQNERALFLGNAAGMNLDGFNARSVDGYGGFMVSVREFFARTKAYADVYLLNTRPRFLGEPLIIPTLKTGENPVMPQ